MKSSEKITPIDTFNDPLLTEEEKEILLGYNLYYKLKNMTKKYKLVKKYPNSLLVGSTVTQLNKDTYICNDYYWSGYKKLDAAEIENNPEFWEEVKDYEISQKYITGEIRSVKRLSDGAVFAKGDKIKAGPFVQDRKYTVIDEIYYNEHGQLSYRTNSGEAPKVFVFNETTEHYKEPLFTTEDGIDIFDGDRVFLVKQYKNPLKIHIFSIDSWRNYYGNKGKPVDSDLAFYSEEAAEKFVEENKPKYSEKDMFESFREGIQSNVFLFGEFIERYNKEKFGNNE